MSEVSMDEETEGVNPLDHMSKTVDLGGGFPVNHISPSQLNTMATCGMVWYFSYVEGWKVPPGFAAHQGSGVHAGAEHNYVQKVETRKDVKVSDIVDASVAGYDERLERDGVSAMEDSGRSVSDQKDAYRDSTALAARVFATDIAPNVQPVMVEKTIEAPLSGVGVEGLVILGTVDVISEYDPANPIDERRLIRDLKTSGRYWSQRDVDTMLQLGFYEVLYRALHGKPSEGGVIDLVNVIIRKTKTNVAAKEFVTVLDDAACSQTLWRLQNMVNAIKAGVFVPADPGHWKCTPKWCGYYHKCPAVRDRYRVQIDMGGK